MDKKFDRVDKHFQDSFQDFSPLPSDIVLKKVQNQLLEKYALERKKKRRKFFLFFIGFILLVGYCFYFQTLNKSTGIAVSNSKNRVHKETSNPNRNTLIESPIRESLIKNEVKILNNKKELAFSETKSISKNEKVVDLKHIPPSIKNETNKENFQTFAEADIENQFEENRNFLNSKRNRIELAKLKDNAINTLAILPATVPFSKIIVSKPSFLNRLNLSLWTSNSRFDRKLKDNSDVVGNPNESKDFYEMHESQNAAWSYGVKIGVHLKKNWSVETGLSLIQFSMLSHYDIPVVYTNNAPLQAVMFTSFNTNNIEFELKNTNGLKNGDLVTIREKMEQKIRWLSLPILADYRINLGLLEVNLLGGITTNIFLNSQLKIDEQTSEIQNFRHKFSERAGKFHLGYQGEINLQYYINSKNAIYTGFHFQNSLTSLNNDKAVNFYPSALGWQIGLKKYFK